MVSFLFSTLAPHLTELSKVYQAKASIELCINNFLMPLLNTSLMLTAKSLIVN